MVIICVFAAIFGLFIFLIIGLRIRSFIKRRCGLQSQPKFRHTNKPVQLMDLREQIFKPYNSISSKLPNTSVTTTTETKIQSVNGIETPAPYSLRYNFPTDKELQLYDWIQEASVYYKDHPSLVHSLPISYFSSNMRSKRLGNTASYFPYSISQDISFYPGYSVRPDTFEFRYGMPLASSKINPDWSWAKLSGHEDFQDEEDPYDEERFLLCGRKRIGTKNRIEESKKKSKRLMSKCFAQINILNNYQQALAELTESTTEAPIHSSPLDLESHSFGASEEENSSLMLDSPGPDKLEIPSRWKKTFEISDFELTATGSLSSQKPSKITFSESFIANSKNESADDEHSLQLEQKETQYSNNEENNIVVASTTINEKIYNIKNKSQGKNQKKTHVKLPTKICFPTLKRGKQEIDKFADSDQEENEILESSFSNDNRRKSAQRMSRTDTQNPKTGCVKNWSFKRNRAPSQSLVMEIEQIMKKHYEAVGVVRKNMSVTNNSRLVKNSQHASQPLLDKLHQKENTVSIPSFNLARNIRTASVVNIGHKKKRNIRFSYSTKNTLQRAKSNSAFLGSEAFYFTPPILQIDNKFCDIERRGSLVANSPSHMQIQDLYEEINMGRIIRIPPPLIIQQATPNSHHSSSNIPFLKSESNLTNIKSDKEEEEEEEENATSLDFKSQSSFPLYRSNSCQEKDLKRSSRRSSSTPIMSQGSNKQRSITSSPINPIPNSNYLHPTSFYLQ